MSLTEADQARLKSLLSEAFKKDQPQRAVHSGQQAVQLAESSGELRKIFDAKAAYAIALLYDGQPANALPLVGWCMASLEKHDELFPKRSIMTTLLPLLLDQSAGIASISGDHFDQLAARFKRLLESSGESVKGYYRMQMKVAVSRGDRHRYQEACRKFLTSPGELTFQCGACIQNSLAHFAFQLGDYAAAWEHALPIISGEKKCSEVPQVTYGAVLRWLVETDDIERADHFHELGISQMPRLPRLLDEYAPHVSYLVCRERWKEAMPLISELLNWAGRSNSEEARLRLYYAVRPVAQRCNDEHFCVRMPDGKRPDKRVFQEVVEGEIRQLAQSLNARNGNQFASNGFGEPYTFPIIGAA